MLPKIQAIGTAFSAMKTEVHKQTNEELVAEANIGRLSDVSKTSGIKETALAPNSNEKTVVFADPVNGYLVKLNLSNENIDKLKKHFGGGEDNFYERKDGTLRLNGKAEAHVSGWFGDIAYKREFIKADSNSDGKLDDTEYGQTRNQFNGYGEAFGAGDNIESITERVTQSYVKVSEETRSRIVNYSYGKVRPNSLDEELNTTINADQDLNGVMSLSEAYKTDKNNQTKNTSKIIFEHAKKALGNTIGNNRESPFKDKTLEELGYYIEKTDSKEAQQAFEKLKAANGDESTLSTDEREVLEVEISKMKEQQTDLNSVKEGIKTSVEATRFIDLKG